MRLTLFPRAGFSRRALLRAFGPYAIGWLALLGLARPLRALTEVAPHAGFTLLSDAEFAFLDAAVARLIPNDALGPGAREAGVVAFLDRELSGPYGKASRWYMSGPFGPGNPYQGWQLQWTPAAFYRAAIPAIDAACKARFGGSFASLPPDKQDAALTAMEKGELQTGSVPADQFFRLLWQNTLEGFFADPKYGGNRDMVGWKLIGFPGARGDFRDFIIQHGKPYPYPPVDLAAQRANGSMGAPHGEHMK